ncbi:hypothetical protein [Microbispora siamensis]|uniref:Uncharacterized protein n=1 Tax=Microbispora siamensis TaxID=564413 RepID=A0ABQ4GN54_9ACTN|nr:hypothetical protein [Microbispora siamensis]GIH62859.1 hypothetical protein Msi02_36760 [Microbispora siamensis]
MAHLKTSPGQPGSEAGRHASARQATGRPSDEVHRRYWDAEQRLAAARLDEVEPAWAISYGLGSRRFYAIATWPVPHPLILDATSLDELRELMREAEMTPAAYGHVRHIGGGLA